MDEKLFETFRAITNIRGDNTGSSMTQHSINTINARFTDSPSYRRAKVFSRQHPEIDEIDVRVVSVDRMGTLREVIFRPDSALDRGTYLGFDGSIWLIYDAYINTISPKATVQECNEFLRFKGSDGEVKEYYAFVGASDLGSKAKQSRAEISYNKYDMKEPKAQNFVYVESNEFTNELDVNSRLILGKRAFKVIGKDDSTLTQLQLEETDNSFAYGIIILSLQIDTVKAYDSIEDSVAQEFGEGTEEWGFD